MAWWSYKNTIINLDKVEQIQFNEKNLEIFIYYPAIDIDLETANCFVVAFENLEDYTKAKHELFSLTDLKRFFNSPLSLDS